jgi:hypothetical protein
MKMTIDRHPDSERIIDTGTPIVGRDCTEKKTETGTAAAETTTDDVAMTTVEKTAVVTTTVDVTTTIGTEIGTGKGIETEQGI